VKIIYVSSSTKVTVTVNPIPTSLTVDNLVCNYNGNNQISAILKSNNNPLSNENVVLNINGHNYNGKTDYKGQVSFSFNEEPNLYKATFTFSKIGYALCSKQIQILIEPIPTSLTVDDLICEYGKDNYLHAYLKSNNNPLSNQEISFSINNIVYKSKTNSRGEVSYKINLEPGEYDCKVSYSDKYYKSVSKIVKLNVLSKLNNFEYSVSIPNYVNLTNYWRVVNDGYLSPNYIATPGAGGKVKMPVNREYIILTKKDSYIYSSSNLKSKNILLDIDDLSKLEISGNSEYTKFTFYSVCPIDVNQISAVFRQKEYNYMLYPDYEELLIVINRDVKVSIGFSNPISWDETGVRWAFSGNNNGHINDAMWCRYDAFNHYQDLRFAETGELVEYRSDMLKINNFPTREKITTHFQMNSTSIMKDEWVSFGKHYDQINSFEVVQSYAVTNKPITNQILDYWIDLNQWYPVGAMRAAYGTFFTALNTIAMYDQYLMNISDLYDVTPIREGFAVSMCGVEYGGTAYVHTPDPTLKYKLYGENENVYICRYFSSLFLGEFESYSLNCAGIPSISSMNYVFTNIFNRNFTVSSTEDYTIIQIDDVPEHQIKLNLSSGLIYDLTINDGFMYKGAISCNPNNYCFHDFLTDKLISNVLKNRNAEGIELSDRDIEFFEDTLSELALSSAVALIPVLAVSWGIPHIFLPTLALTASLVTIGVLLKIHLRDFDVKAGIGDSLTSLVHSKVIS